MRVDVFLKQTRLVKRRSLAKELCDEGAVAINGHPARAGREINPGDAVTLTLRNRRIELEVVGVPERAPSAAAAGDFFEITSDERIEHD